MNEWLCIGFRPGVCKKHAGDSAGVYRIVLRRSCFWQLHHTLCAASHSACDTDSIERLDHYQAPPLTMQSTRLSSMYDHDSLLATCSLYRLLVVNLVVCKVHLFWLKIQSIIYCIVLHCTACCNYVICLYRDQA